MSVINSEHDYNASIARYEEIKYAVKGTNEHKEKMSLVHIITAYEKSTFNLPDVSPIELAEIRSNDFGFQSL